MTFYFFKTGRKIMGAVRFIDVALNNSGSELVIFHMLSHTLYVIWYFTSFVSLPGNMKRSHVWHACIFSNVHCGRTHRSSAQWLIWHGNAATVTVSSQLYNIMGKFFMYALYYMHMTLQWRYNYALWVALLVNDNYTNLIEYK